jgi:hypothetical protein
LPWFGKKFKTFTLELNPVMGRVDPGGSASASVVIKSSSREISTVRLSAGATPESGLPQGVEVSFTPPQGTPPFTSTMNVSASPKIAHGAYSFLVLAVGDDVKQMATYTLIVRSEKPLVRKTTAKEAGGSTRKRKTR